MTIDLFTATGEKKGTLALPEALFSARVNPGLMHLALVRQQSNRRRPVAHVKHRGEIVGSTRKLYAQKGTGRARRGSIRSPLLRGGGKSFGPRSSANFRKDMPRKMRRAALLSCLTLRAKEGAIIGLEHYPDTVKTKSLMELLQKLPVTLGRRIVIVLPGKHRGLMLSARNIPRVKTLLVQYLNPEDLLLAKNIVFLEEAVMEAERVFGGRQRKDEEEKEDKEEREEVSMEQSDDGAKKKSVRKTAIRTSPPAANPHQSSTPPRK